MSALTDLLNALTVDYYVRKPTTTLVRTEITCCDRAPVPTGVVCVACRMELLEWAEAWRLEDDEAWATEWTED